MTTGIFQCNTHFQSGEHRFRIFQFQKRGIESAERIFQKIVKRQHMHNNVGTLGAPVCKGVGMRKMLGNDRAFPGTDRSLQTVDFKLKTTIQSKQNQIVGDLALRDIPVFPAMPERYIQNNKPDSIQKTDGIPCFFRREKGFQTVLTFVSVKAVLFHKVAKISIS